MNLLVLLLPVGFSLLFYVSFVTKLFAFHEFKQSILDFGFISKNYVPHIHYVAGMVLLVELMLASCFALSIYLRVTYALAFVLLLGFTGLFLNASLNKKQVNCSCFGSSEKHTNNKLAILRNLLLMFLVGYGFFDHGESVRRYELQTLLSLIGIALGYEVVRRFKRTLTFFIS